MDKCIGRHPLPTPYQVRKMPQRQRSPARAVAEGVPIAQVDALPDTARTLRLLTSRLVLLVEVMHDAFAHNDVRTAFREGVDAQVTLVTEAAAEVHRIVDERDALLLAIGIDEPQVDRLLRAA